MDILRMSNFSKKASLIKSIFDTFNLGKTFLYINTHYFKP